MRNFRQYDIYVKAINFSNTIYRLCNVFPKEERFALTDQLLRATVSIPSNIAEGSSRESEMDFCHFLEIALGSAFEVETQLTIARNQNYLTQDHYNKVLDELLQLQLGIGLFVKNIRKTSPKTRKNITLQQ